MVLTDFLAQVLKAKRARLAHLRASPVEALRTEALASRHNAPPHLLRSAMVLPDCLNIIAEIKRVTPKGIIQPEINPTELALAYSRGGAAAISVFTEEDFFQGSLNDLRAVRAVAPIPVLRKDLIIEPRQVYETAIVGADALLLMMGALDERQIALLRHIAEEELGLDVLMKVHNTTEMLQAHALGATLIEVGSRDPYTHNVPLDVSVEIARRAPEEVLLISAGDRLKGRQLRGLRALGYKGFLIGESLLRESAPEEALRELLRSAEL